MMNFIPKTEKNEVISVRLSSKTVLLLDQHAKEHNMSRNKFISQCIDFALEHLEQKHD